MPEGYNVLGSNGFGQGITIAAPIAGIPTSQAPLAGTLGLGMMDSNQLQGGGQLIDNEETWPDTEGFYYNDENIFSNFNGINFDKLSTKASNGLKVFIEGGSALAKEYLMHKLQKANPKSAGAVNQILTLFALQGKAKALSAKSGGVTPTGLMGNLKGITAPQLSPAEQSDFEEKFENFIGLHTRVLNNRAEFSNFSGTADVDFNGFTDAEKAEYSNFLGIDFGKIASSIGHAVGGAAKAVGNTVSTLANTAGHAVASVATGIGNVARDVGVGVAHGVARAAVATGQTVARGAVFAGRNAGGILTTAAGVGLEFVPGAQELGASLIGAGLGSVITDANGGVNPFTDQTNTDAAAQAAALAAAGASGGMMGDGFNPNPDPYGLLQSDGSEDDNSISPEDIYAQQDAAAQATAEANKPKPTPFYKQPWFLISAAVAVAIAGYFIYKHYHKHGHKK